jgi:hypothetical protein
MVINYHIIHSCLSHHDYRRLMNTSLSLFSEIKFETVFYRIICDFSYDDDDAIIKGGTFSQL